MRILSAHDVRQAVPMAAAVDAVAAAFAQLSAGHATVPLRTRLDVPAAQAVSFFMPAHVADPAAPALGLKVVSVFPHNASLAIPTIHALVVLVDPTTGKALAALDGTYLTALRTGAGSGAATRHMARPESKVLVLFGAGAQARTQAHAVCAVRPIETIWIVNRTPTRAAELAETLRNDGLTAALRVAADARSALAEADVVCCATTSATPVFDDGDLRPGTHINGVGSFLHTMAEVPPATVQRARVIVDQRVAAWAEAGDLVQPHEAGLIGQEHVVGELGEVVSGHVAGRTSPEEITFFKSVGNAVQDLAVASLALQRAEAMGLGVEVAL
ncbi:MAG: ornithine cyclodeaminase [Chloroflexaceae bacterium]|jgi:ornithine cyclodeaminase|nr:ornithine cyclodeaminase [Chloroflexaceae bacterium]